MRPIEEPRSDNAHLAHLFVSKIYMCLPMLNLENVPKLVPYNKSSTADIGLLLTYVYHILIVAQYQCPKEVFATKITKYRLAKIWASYCHM
jgi:hypothetical protein